VVKSVFHKKLMNTDFAIIVFNQNSKLTNRLVEVAFDEVENLISKYSRFLPGSEISQINNSELSKIEIKPEMYSFCKYCNEIGNLTDGVFDYTILDLLQAIGYSKSYVEGENFSQKSIEQIQRLIKKRKNFLDIKLIKEDNKYYISKDPEIKIEFGGFMKGYAVDKIIEILRPLENVLVDGGGDIRCLGTKFEDDKPFNWKVGLMNPCGKTNEFIDLPSEFSITCSGAQARKFGELNHLINPHKFDFKKDYDLAFIYGNSNEFEQTIPINSKEKLLTTYCDTFSTVAYIIGDKIKKYLPKGLYVIFR
jgi:thiamine biosynthesis lipoprotein ApbE